MRSLRPIVSAFLGTQLASGFSQVPASSGLLFPQRPQGFVPHSKVPTVPSGLGLAGLLSLPACCAVFYRKLFLATVCLSLEPRACGHVLGSSRSADSSVAALWFPHKPTGQLSLLAPS